HHFHLKTDGKPAVEQTFNLLTAPVDTLPEGIRTDTLLMDEILIRSTRIAEPARYQPVEVQFIDSLQLSLYRSASVSALLSRYSSLFIKDNGPGGLATVSQRGLSSSQTMVLWEGFPLNSLSLGLADLSTIPSGLFTSVEVSPGTPSSSFGGGSLGGTVYLSSDESGRENRFGLGQSVGAFGKWSSRVQADWEEGRWSVFLRGIYQEAQNDFSYWNRARNREEKRVHNAGRAGNLLGSIRYQLPLTRFYSSFWLYDNLDDIPGSILAGNPQAEQYNRGWRWVGGMKTAIQNWQADISSYLERDWFGYDDPAIDTRSRFLRTRWLADVDLIRPSEDPVVWKAGVSGGIEGIDTNNYTSRPHRHSGSIRLNPDIRIADQRLRLSPAIRGDAYSDFGFVVSPSLGMNWEAVENLIHLRGLLSRDFNPPSFNDLYWVPGGNQDLKPERSFRTEAGTHLLPGLNWIEAIRFTGYRIWLENGIYWTPGEQGVWSPYNVQYVDAYGAEASLDLMWQAGPVAFEWNLSAEWRRSQIASARFAGDQAVGNQMRYVPEWSFRNNLMAATNWLSLLLSHRWTDRRYITLDQQSSLDPYQVVDVTTLWTPSLLGVQWTFRGTLHNLFDEQFEIIQWYPLPGRYLEVSVGINLTDQ
ncbi:MAG: TonB-dependent receptor plug domain-containing protein, partial [Balneolaceae bacterium]